MTYPTYNGKQFDSLRKQKFNFYRSVFENTIKATKDGYNLTEKQIKVLAWNMAYEVSVDRYKY